MLWFAWGIILQVKIQQNKRNNNACGSNPGTPAGDAILSFKDKQSGKGQDDQPTGKHICKPRP